MMRFTVYVFLAFALTACGGAVFEPGLFDDVPPDAPVAATDAGVDTSDAPLRGPTTPHDASLEADFAALDAGVDGADACPLHYDGFGNTFYSCATTGLELAHAACYASGGITCGNADTSACADVGGHYVSSNDFDGGSCREWGYAGDITGRAFGACGCPKDAGVAWW